MYLRYFISHRILYSPSALPRLPRTYNTHLQERLKVRHHDDVSLFLASRWRRLRYDIDDTILSSLLSKLWYHRVGRQKKRRGSVSPTIITTCVISFFAAEREKGEEEEVCMVVCCCMVWYDTIVHNNNNPLHTQEVEKREGFVRLFDNKRKRENSHHDDEEKRTRREDRGEEEEKRERRKKKREENEFTDVSVPNGQKSKKRDSRFQIPNSVNAVACRPPPLKSF